MIHLKMKIYHQEILRVIIYYKKIYYKKNIQYLIMRLSLLMFVIGVIFVVSGYIQDNDPHCKPKTEVRIIPRNVYDQLIQDSTL